jgi:hypothetical protein
LVRGAAVLLLIPDDDFFFAMGGVMPAEMPFTLASRLPGE